MNTAGTREAKRAAEYTNLAGNRLAETAAAVKIKAERITGIFRKITTVSRTTWSDFGSDLVSELVSKILPQ